MLYIIDCDGKKISLRTAIELMDENLREKIHSEIAPCSEQDFFDAYCAAHRKKFGEDFKVN